MDFKNIPPERMNKISFSRPDVIDSKLYIISPIFNSPRYRTIWKLYNEFELMVINSGAHLVTIEASFGNRAESIVEQSSDNHIVIHVRANSELWIKENLINIALQYLPEDAQYICWVDSDVKFSRADWVGETIQQLQHYDVVQMFSVAIDMSPDGVPYQFNRGFVYDYSKGIPIKMQFSKNILIPNVNQKVGLLNNAYCDDCPDTGELKINYFHPGFAWAYRRKSLEDLGGLYEYAILGAGDAHMASSFVGHVMDTVHPKMSDEYKNLVSIWQDRALKYINKNIGYVDGTILHSFHGAKKNRKYGERWKILVDEKFTPSTDIKKNLQGVFQLENNKPLLRDKIRNYFAERNSDSISMEGIIGFLE